MALFLLWTLCLLQPATLAHLRSSTDAKSLTHIVAVNVSVNKLSVSKVSKVSKVSNVSNVSNVSMTKRFNETDQDITAFGSNISENPSPLPPTTHTKVHLMSFRSCSQDKAKPCNKIFFQQLKDLSAKAARVPTITNHHLFQGLPDEIYNDPKWSVHVKEKHAGHGRGYWFWKPALFNYLVRHEQIQGGDIVVWMDPDSYAYIELSDEDWQRRLESFNRKSFSDGLDFLVTTQSECEFEWTKEDIFVKFNTTWSDPYYGLSGQGHAQFWVLSVNERTLKFMKMWEDLMSDFTLCSDEESATPNNPFFRQNRHDQSMLSMLLKAQGAPILDQGWSQSCHSLRDRAVVVHRHHKNVSHGNLSKEKIRSIEEIAAKDSAEREHPKHSVFGIANLRAIIADFNDANILKGSGKMKTGRWAQEGVRAERNIYVRGQRFDLDLMSPPRRAHSFKKKRKRKKDIG